MIAVAFSPSGSDLLSLVADGPGGTVALSISSAAGEGEVVRGMVVTTLFEGVMRGGVFCCTAVCQPRRRCALFAASFFCFVVHDAVRTIRQCFIQSLALSPSHTRPKPRADATFPLPVLCPSNCGIFGVLN